MARKSQKLSLNKLIERMYSALYEMDCLEGKNPVRVTQCQRRAQKYYNKIVKNYPDALLPDNSFNVPV